MHIAPGDVERAGDPAQQAVPKLGVYTGHSQRLLQLGGRLQWIVVTDFVLLWRLAEDLAEPASSLA